MVTPEERQEIINAAVEKALLMLPDVVGNLVASQIANSKLTSAFYNDNPEMRDHKDAVVSILEKLENDNPGMKYEDLLKLAVPEIKARIQVKQSLNTTHVQERGQVDRRLHHLPDLGEL